MVLYAQGLVPARFLTLLSHLTVVILIFCSRRENVEACLSLDSTEEEFQVKDFELSVGLITSIVLLGIELIGFLLGVSMFMPSAAIISIGGHFIGSVALSYFIFDQWDCNIFWWIFTFCSVIPALVEIIVAIGLPEKYKGTVVEKWYKYWEGLIQDYSDVFRDTIRETHTKPFKSIGIVGAGIFSLYAICNNPSEIDFRNQLTEYQNLFGLVGKPVRNPSADTYLKYIQNSYNYGLIRRFSFGIFSVIWLDNYDPGLGLYKTQCSYLKPEFKNFHERIIDVGFLNKYWMMERKMFDYDVNPNEWIDFSKTEYFYRHRIPSE